jgi:hypothetical protein
MIENNRLKLDPRHADEWFQALRSRLPAYTPGWEPTSLGAADALTRIFVRYLEILGERVNEAPDKNKLAFLDLLGVNLLPAMPARAPIVFKLLPNGRDSRALVRSRVGAKIPGRDEPLVFETEEAVGLAAAQLIEVRTVWPGKDSYADHSPEALAGKNFKLFADLKPIPHEMYIAHDVYFALSGKCAVELQCELSPPGSQPLDMVWEYWDGEVWRGFKPFVGAEEAGADYSLDGTEGFTRSGVIHLATDCAAAEKTTIGGIESYWLRGRLQDPLPPDARSELPLLDVIHIQTTISPRIQDAKSAQNNGLVPDQAFADSLELDLSKTFYPFGQQPQPGSCFFIRCDEAFGKPGALVALYCSPSLRTTWPKGNKPNLKAEYWDGKCWRECTGVSDLPNFFKKGGKISFTVAPDHTLAKIGGKEGSWLRIRMDSGFFGRKHVVKGTTIPIYETIPPAFKFIAIDYSYTSPKEPPQACLTHNDFQWRDRSDAARWRGSSFEPFTVVEDLTPTLYLGFDKPLPADRLGLYFGVQEEAEETIHPALRWEYWSGKSWEDLSVEDDTRRLTIPGIVKFTWPGVPQSAAITIVRNAGRVVELAQASGAAPFSSDDLVYLSLKEEGELKTVEAVSGATLILKTPSSRSFAGGLVERATLPRFGTPRTWIRARLELDGTAPQLRIEGLFSNAVWAAQVQTLENEILGGSNGQPNQVFFCRRSPVLPGEVIQVKELEGALARVEFPILLEQLRKLGMSEKDVETEERAGAITGVWVSWRSSPHFYFSQAADRHYMIERSGGRVIFGDGQHGLIPPAGLNNVRVRKYRSGGGADGNVPAGAIGQLLSAPPFVQGVTNPRGAEGGADAELSAGVHRRGAHVLRHRAQAVTLTDYENLAREASPALAVARALPSENAAGHMATKGVRLILVPNSHEPRPQPSLELRERVAAYLAARVPATAAPELTITGPVYLPVGIEVVVAPVDPSAAGIVYDAVKRRLEEFLHPLTGGPEGTGWPFGRDVFQSDVARILENLPGVDYIKTINLLLDGTPQGERVAVPPDRIVVAGALNIRLTN